MNVFVDLWDLSLFLPPDILGGSEGGEERKREQKREEREGRGGNGKRINSPSMSNISSAMSHTHGKRDSIIIPSHESVLERCNQRSLGTVTGKVSK